MKAVIIGGRLVAQDGKMLIPFKNVTYPDWSKNTVNVGKTLTPQDFMLTSNKPEVKVRVIQIEEAKVTTKQVIETLKTIDGNVLPDTEKDIAKAALFERHKTAVQRGWVL